MKTLLKLALIAAVGAVLGALTFAILPHSGEGHSATRNQAPENSPQAPPRHHPVLAGDT